MDFGKGRVNKYNNKKEKIKYSNILKTQNSQNNFFVLPFESKNITFSVMFLADPRTFKGSSAKHTLQIQGKSF